MITRIDYESTDGSRTAQVERTIDDTVSRRVTGWGVLLAMHGRARPWTRLTWHRRMDVAQRQAERFCAAALAREDRHA